MPRGGPVGRAERLRGVAAADAPAGGDVIALPTCDTHYEWLEPSAAARGDVSVALDVPGIIAGRVEVDVETPRAGEADVVVTSKTIPKLPHTKTCKNQIQPLFITLQPCGPSPETDIWLRTQILPFC